MPPSAARRQKELWADYAAFNEALAKAGAPSPASGCSRARRRPPCASRDGKTDVLDGPYADTKEQFAGYFFVEAADLDEAIAWAKRCPVEQVRLDRNPPGPCRQGD